MQTLRLCLATLCLLFSGLGLRAQYITNGSAVATGSCFRLTPADYFQSGSTWYANMVDISQPFDLYINIFLGCLDANGADGMAFVLQPISTSIGTAGEGLGYEGVVPSFVLEFDTWQNVNRNDPAYDHLAIQVNGVVTHYTPQNLAGPTPILPGVGNAEDCMEHALHVTWNPDSQIFRAYVDCNLRISYTGDIINNIFNGNPMVFWGFTSATGGSINEHRFCLDYISFTEDLRDTAICEGQSVQLFVGSGDSFSWTPTTGLSNPTIANPVATPLQTTTYVATITDVCGQQRRDTVTVIVVDTLLDVLPAQTRLCNGQAVISAYVPGGTYLWDNGATTASRVVSQPGIYRVFITNPCSTLVDSIEVLPARQATFSSQNATCAGAATGSATVGLASVPPYNITWSTATGTLIQTLSNNSGTHTRNGLAAGDYRVIISDGDGCADTVLFTITEPPALAGQLLSQTFILCGGSATGSFTLQGSGGTPPYTYSATGSNFQSSPTLSNLAAGSYNAVVRDANGCTSTVPVTLLQNPPLVASAVAQTNVLCNGSSTGALTFGGSGGTPPYSFSLNGSPFQSSATFANLPAGGYVLTLRDANNCTVQLNRTITQPAPLDIVLAAQRHVDCSGNATGAFTLRGTGGVGPYSYALGAAPLTSDSVFTGLAAGSYLLRLEDANGCPYSETATITEPAPLAATLLGLTDVDCNGNSSGVTDLGASGGTQPYSFAMAGGVFGANAVFDSLPTGTYTLVVRDDSACLDSVDVFIDEPAPLAIAVTDRVDVDCLGNNSGILTGQASGGTQPYAYAINTGGTTGLFGAGNSFDSLYAGFYTLLVRDSNACVASIDTFITTPTGLTAGIDTLVPVACNGDSSAYFTLVAQGGTAPYQYSFDGVSFSFDTIYTGLPVMQDTITLYDANGCIVPIPFEITEPPLLTGGIAVQADVACLGQATGWIRATAAGGVAPYAFSLDTLFTSDSTFTGLAAGSYTLTIRDANACLLAVPFDITEPPLLQATIADQRNVDCYGQATAAFQVVASGGVPVYSYTFDSLTTDSLGLYSGLAAGTYTIVVVDDSACTTTIQAVITQPDTLIAQVADQQDIACFGDATGAFAAVVQGGTYPYTYSLNSLPRGSDSLYLGLTAGSYTVVVEDDSGCVAAFQTTLVQPTDRVLTLAGQDNVDCYGNGNGRLAFSASGGVSPYTFDLGSGPGADSVFAGLVPGSYTLVMQDANSCTDTLGPLAITQPDSLTLAFETGDVSCHSGSDGEALALVNGGTLPYTYLWDLPVPFGSDRATGLRAGTYGMLLRDANDCVVSGFFTIGEPDTLVLSLVGVTDAYCNWDNGVAEVAATGGTPDYSFVWEGLPGLDAPRAEAIAGGAYLVQVRDALGCTDTLLVRVGNTPPATPAFTSIPPFETPVLESEAEIQFINLSEGAVVYRWDLGIAGAISDATEPSYTYPPGEYTITLTAYNSFFACPESLSHTLVVIPDGRLFIPNAFSPNGDGDNDFFLLKGEGVVQMELILFNRWGREIYRMNSLDDRWDGITAQGMVAPEGVYAFVLSAQFNSGQRIERGGTVTLFR
ncbi:MAG: hypothetical protein OHK0039_43680 [Bacteroidia bacterium]